MPSAFLLVASESLPVVDIDNTVFIQAGLFLLLLAILHPLLFKPWLEVRDRRAARIGGALDEAAKLREAAEEREADYEARLAKARDDAMSLRSDRRRTAEEEEATILGEARREAAKQLAETKAKLSDEVEGARGDLAGKVDALADDISKRVLGRTA